MEAGQRPRRAPAAPPDTTHAAGGGLSGARGRARPRRLPLAIVRPSRGLRLTGPGQAAPRGSDRYPPRLPPATPSPPAVAGSYPSRGSRPRSPRCDKGPSWPRLPRRGRKKNKAGRGRLGAARTETKAQRRPKGHSGNVDRGSAGGFSALPRGWGAMRPPMLPVPPARSGCAAPVPRL